MHCFVASGGYSLRHHVQSTGQGATFCAVVLQGQTRVKQVGWIQYYNEKLLAHVCQTFSVGDQSLSSRQLKIPWKITVSERKLQSTHHL